MRRNDLFLLVFVVFCLVFFVGCGQVEFERGLAGLTFNDDKFERCDDLDILVNLDNDWCGERGSDWSARWGGYIEGPFDGAVTFSAEANDGLVLRIGDAVVIDGLNSTGARCGTVFMAKGKKLPVTLHFVSNRGMAKLRLFWQWQGGVKSIIGADAFSYDPVVIDEIWEELTPPGDATAEMLANQYCGPREKLHVYLLIGQSNMCGRAVIPEADKGPMEGCYMFDREDRWVPASNPLNRYSSIISNTSNQRLNPGYMFAKTMRRKDPNVSIGLIGNAKGATSIERWIPGTRYYDQAIKRVKAARGTGVFKGVLWHQGEGNYTDSNYHVKLKKLIVRMRKDLGEKEMPFVAGGICESDTSPGGELINAQLAELAGKVPFMGFASSEGLDSFDGKWHFRPEDMKILGRRYAEAMSKIIDD
ncbi:MAG: sialate O-acetylesterase [Planctomycetota bacterium]